MNVRDFDVPAEVAERYPTLFASHQSNGEFFNPWRTGNQKPRTTDLLKWQLSKNPHKAAKKAETPVAVDRAGLAPFNNATGAKSLWLGHATFLIEVDGFRALIDPVYGVVGAFVKRFTEHPFPLADLPPLDAVILTHGHYDHLDTQTLDTVAKLQPGAQFVAPLGQGRYVPRSAGEVLEVDWWQSIDFGGVEAVFLPAQHWHRRGAFDYNKGLWGGWMFRGSQTIFHAGDSGYFDGFKLLGELFEVDLALLPVGAFEPRWFMKSQHMNPEDSLQAFADLNASHFVAMHWGTYDLTDEPLNMGADEVRRLAEESGIAARVHAPAPGGFVGA